MMEGERGGRIKEYIEREAAIALSKDIIVPQASGVDYKHRCIDPQDIRDIPAADVVEVRHGQWVHGREVDREYIGDCLVGIFYDRWTCSECGYVVDDHEYSGVNYKFCPNCGAKMTEV